MSKKFKVRKLDEKAARAVDALASKMEHDAKALRRAARAFRVGDVERAGDEIENVHAAVDLPEYVMDAMLLPIGRDGGVA
jgi:hypothetical protein